MGFGVTDLFQDGKHFFNHFCIETRYYIQNLSKIVINRFNFVMHFIRGTT